MKTETLIITLAVTLSVVISTKAQDTFQNLNFELANTGSLTFALNVPVTSALPYWEVTIGGVPQTEMPYNAPSLGSPEAVLVGPGYGAGVAPIDGNYSVLLTGSFPAAFPSISQTALIPSGTESLLFEAEPGNGDLVVLVGTQPVTFAAIGSGGNYTLYGANISAWAGKTEQLTFSALQFTSGLNNWELDDIAFSTISITPEPGTVALTAISGLLFCARKWFARR